MNGCIACGRRLYFSERVAMPQVFCFPCACARGITRLADCARYLCLAADASRLPSWWRWTVYLEHALQWAALNERRAQA